MWNVQPNKRFCEKCLHDKNLEYARNGYERQKAQKAEKKQIAWGVSCAKCTELRELPDKPIPMEHEHGT